MTTELPSYKNLFGEINFKEGDEARSVYSPAAYLTDLLQLIDDELASITDPQEADYAAQLNQRRSDIQEIILDKEQTFELLPYLDIVNEALAAKVAEAPLEGYLDQAPLSSKKADGTLTAYDILKNAKYPFNLPFDLQEKRVKLYLQYLSVTPQELYTGFATSPVNQIIARESLLLSAAQETLITQALDSSAELNLAYGNKITALGSSEAIDVEEFLAATEISHLELKALLRVNLSEFERDNVDTSQGLKLDDLYLNHGLAGAAVLNTEETALQWRVAAENEQAGIIPLAWFDRAYRFIHLAKELGLSFTECELVLRRCCDNTLDEQAIMNIAVIKHLQSSFDLKMDETCALVSAINNAGFTDEEQPQDLFNRIFNGNCAEIDESYIGKQVAEQYQDYQRVSPLGDILLLENKSYRQRVASALGMSDQQLQKLITGFRSRKNQDLDDEDLYDKLWTFTDNNSDTLDSLEYAMLATLYRVRKLALYCDLSTEALFNLLDVFETDPLIRNACIKATAYQGALLNLSIDERNCYHILIQGDVEQNLWLAQALSSVSTWLTENDLTASELLAITSNRLPRHLLNGKLENDQAAKEQLAQETQSNITVFNQLVKKVSSSLLSDTSYVSKSINQRFSRIIHGIVTSQKDLLVTRDDARLAHENTAAIKAAAMNAIAELDHISRDDFLGLGLEEKIAQKVFDNLVSLGYLSSEGDLQLEKLPAQANEFYLETDFSAVKRPLFDLFATRHLDYVDAAIYLSDLDFLNLSVNERAELYDNLMFNGYIADDGQITQTPTFASDDNIDLFEVNSRIGVYAQTIYQQLQKQVKRFNHEKIPLTSALFEDLPLSAIEIDDLLQNLKFNGYLDENNQMADNQAMAALNADTLLLELQFYPQRTQILALIHQQIKSYQAKYHQFKQTQFVDVADSLVADWIYQVLNSYFIDGERFTEEAITFFNESENAAEFDVSWPFSVNDNLVVFKRIQSIIKDSGNYRFSSNLLASLNFEAAQSDELIALLISQGNLDFQLKIPKEKVAYFLNIDNALIFELPAFDDYAKDVFFILQKLAKHISSTSKIIESAHQKIAQQQESSVYQTLAEAFALEEVSVRLLSTLIFNDEKHAVDHYLVPVLANLDIDGQITREPQSSLFNTSYRRIKQFAKLAAKLKLSADEISIVFRDQQLVDKFPVNIKLPAITLSDGSEQQITGFDALLESNDGFIYLFKSADKNTETSAFNYARYWMYSSVTNNAIQTPDDKLSTLLTGDKTSSLVVTDVSAAFVDKMGQDVLILDGQYYLHDLLTDEQKALIAEYTLEVGEEKADPDSCINAANIVQRHWQLKDRQWGRTNNEFKQVKQVDAAFTDAAGHSYLFSDDQFVRYSQELTQIDADYPKSIKRDWQDEGHTQVLNESFNCHLDAAFHGTDNKTYLFHDQHFIRSDQADKTEKTFNNKAFWGKVKHTLNTDLGIDGCYQTAGKVFVLSGDQVFAYRDCLENEQLEIMLGYPQPIRDHIETQLSDDAKLPSQFVNGVDAVMYGHDQQLHLYKDKYTVSINLSDGSISPLAEINQLWGKIKAPLEANMGTVDAAFAGLDGRIYLFIGDSYYRYSGSEYAEADSGFPREIAKDWGGLTDINASFIHDGKSYVFGTGEVEDDNGAVTIGKAYVRYSTSDYSEPDLGYPKLQTESEQQWWNFPQSFATSFTEVDAVFNAPDKKSYLFSGQQYICFDHISRWWSEPKSISENWPDLPFSSIDAAFCGKDGKTYFFRGDEYVRFSDVNYCQLDNGYPRTVNKLWANVKNTIAECGKIDAAMSLYSHESSLDEDGIEEEKTTNAHSYLFCGGLFYRYLGSDYSEVEAGYPKSLSELKDEPRFKHFSRAESVLNDDDMSWLSQLDAAFADQRNVYLFSGEHIQVISGQTDETYLAGESNAFESNAFANVNCAFMADGAVYVKQAQTWQHMSAIEGINPVLTQATPVLLADVAATDRQALSAVLQGTDGNSYLFKGDSYFNKQLNREYPIETQWARVRNNIQDKGIIDAVLKARDGKTYVFSGDQYVIYQGNDYIEQSVFQEVDTDSGVHLISEDWYGLENVDITYVLDEKTYLFEKADHLGVRRYLCLSDCELNGEQAVEIQLTDNNHWVFPEEYLASGWQAFDSLVIDNQGFSNGQDSQSFSPLNDSNRQSAQKQSLIFIKNDEFVQYDPNGKHWTEPKALDKLWPDLVCHNDLFEDLSTVFVADDQKVYFFGKHCYQINDNGVLSDERKIASDWGMVTANFNRVDAAFVYQGKVSYLFSGKQYIRYSGTDYRHVDAGYPKLISPDLRQEPGFAHLPADFEMKAAALFVGEPADEDAVVIQGIVSNNQNIYLYMDGQCLVFSGQQRRVLPLKDLSHQSNRFAELGRIDAAFVKGKATYLFSQDQYIRYSGCDYDCPDLGYPKQIATDLANDLVENLAIENSGILLPASFHADLDAALSDKEGNIYLFKGEYFLKLGSETPELIAGNWGEVTNIFTSSEEESSQDIDGAFVDTMGRLYVIKEQQVIRYLDTDQTYIEAGFPQQLTKVFKQLPADYQQGIDGAFTFAGFTYLLDDGHQVEDEPSGLANYCRYLEQSGSEEREAGNDYECLTSPYTSGLYPVTFAERWGNWADYRLCDLSIIACFKTLQENYGGETDLVDLLSQDKGYVKNPYALLAQMFNWDIDEVKWLKRYHAFLPADPGDERRFDLELICRMKDIFALSEKMATDVQTLYQAVWQNRYQLDNNEAAADQLLSFLGSQHCGSTAHDVLTKEIHNKLNLLKRDALLPYAIHLDESAEDARDLYEQLLIDVKMGGSAETSRVKEAIAAVQLYFHRYFINLEPAKLKGESDLSPSTEAEVRRELLKERWNWLRNYRVWEANRKVFLYPENYIRPELRDTKSPQFKVLEEQLLQGELTDANVNQAFNHYIDDYSEVSRLTIAGGYVYDNPKDAQDKDIILFGHTKNEPKQYYYRQASFVQGSSGSVSWQPWTQVNIQIDADRVYPVYALNKMFVFWAKTETRSNASANTKVRIKEENKTYSTASNVVNETVLTFYYSYINLNGEWVAPQKLNYEVSSNDSISSYFLDFSAVRQATEEDIDNINVRCHYTSEREVTPLANDEGQISITELMDLITRANEDNSTGLFLKASNSEHSFYLSHRALTNGETAPDNIESWRPLIASRINPGDTLGDDFRFNVLSTPLNGQGDSEIALSAQSNGQTYLRHNGSKAWVASINNLQLDELVFTLEQASHGAGYSLSLKGDDTYKLFYQLDKQVTFKKWDDSVTDGERKQATFNLIANRKDRVTSFTFYPETNVAQELQSAESISDSQSRTILQSGLNTFEELFPNEDSSKVAQPVLLNVPVNDNSLPWTCFDYKGGSFLCKPVSGQTQIWDDVTFNLPENFAPLDAALHVNDKTYLFNGDNKYIGIEQSVLDSDSQVPDELIESTTADWLPANGPFDRVDAAIVIGESSYLIKDDKYFVYQGTNYDSTVDVYPRDLQNNSDNLPFTGIDAAFRAGDNNYFVRGRQCFTVDSAGVETNLPYSLWPESHLTGVEVVDPLNLCSVFLFNNEYYALDNNDRLIKVANTDFMTDCNNAFPVTKEYYDYYNDTVFVIDNTSYFTATSGSNREYRYDSENKWVGSFICGGVLYYMEKDEEHFHFVEERWGVDKVRSLSGVDNITALFHYRGKIYIFADEDYMVLDDYPDNDLTWTPSGTIADFILGAKLYSAMNYDGQVYITSGDKYIRFSDENNLVDGPDNEVPYDLSTNSHGLPQWTNIDAAFYGPDNKGRYFNGSVFTTSDSLGDTSEIVDHWGKAQNNLLESGKVDAAFTLGDASYLISGDQYYRYVSEDSQSLPQLQAGYPKQLWGNSDGITDYQGVELAFALSYTESGINYEKVYYFYGVNWQWYYSIDSKNGQTQWGATSADMDWPDGFSTFDIAYNIGNSQLFLLKGSSGIKSESPMAAIMAKTLAKYDIVRLSSMTGSKLNKALFIDGIDGLMKPQTQQMDESPRFVFDQGDNTVTEREGDARILVNTDKVSPDYFPVDSHLEFYGANGNYYWELFYHAPSLIAQSLNNAQNFEEAKRWHEYVFNPTQVADYWQFLPFLSVDIDAMNKQLTQVSALSSDIETAVNTLTAKLADYASAFAGHTSLSDAMAAELKLLHQWDDANNRYSTWAEVADLSTLLENAVNDADSDTRLNITNAQEVIAIIERLPVRYQLMIAQGSEQIKAYLDDPFDPHAIASLRRIAYRRTTVMAYIDNLLDWGDNLFRQYTRESINEARMLYVLAYDLLGKKPQSMGKRVLSDSANYSDIKDQGADTQPGQQSSYDMLFDVTPGDAEFSFTHAGIVHESVQDPYFFVPENEQLLTYWNKVEDRLYKIRHSMNISGVEQPLALFQPPIDPMALVNAVASGGLSSASASLKTSVPHYRFDFMLRKTRELANKVSQFGNELLGTIEKQNAEELSLLQNRQEGVILQMNQEIRAAQLRESELHLQSLQENKLSAEQQKQHYNQLIQSGMLDEEETQVDLMTAASNIFYAIPVLKVASAVASAFPDVKAGSPTTIGVTIGGSTVGAALGFAAEALESISEGLSMRGEVAGINAQFERSKEDWSLQLQMAESEINQLDMQIEGAQWQIKGAEHEIKVNEKEQSHNESIATFMKDKFSNKQLYLWLSSKLSSLYFQTYNMAHDMAKSTEMSYRFERGLKNSDVNYIGGGYWQSAKKGLTAGDTLGADLDKMEHAYLETHDRSMEITKTISLLDLDAMALIGLKNTGICEFNFTEQLFDYDFPGHYNRQIKTIAMKIVAGDGRTVNATLTQLRNKTLLEPDAKAVKYLLAPKGTQPMAIRSDWRSSQQIAVSQVDPYSEQSNGLFELNFGDERYLPFEGTGAISSWRLALGGKKGSYDINELQDVLIEIKYSARQGGSTFADTVKGMLKPYDTAVHLDIAQTYPNEFFAFVNGETDELVINITRDDLPNISGSKITGIYSDFEVSDNGQLSMTLNDDSALTLRNKKLLLTNSLAIGSRGETWTFKAKGNKANLENMSIVLAYKAKVV